MEVAYIVNYPNRCPSVFDITSSYITTTLVWLEVYRIKNKVIDKDNMNVIL